MNDPGFAQREMKKGIEPEQASGYFRRQDVQRMSLPDMIQLMPEDGLPFFAIGGKIFIPEQMSEKGKGSAGGTGDIKPVIRWRPSPVLRQQIGYGRSSSPS